MRIFVFVTVLAMAVQINANAKACSDITFRGVKNHFVTSLPSAGKTSEYRFLIGKRKYKIDAYVHQSAWVFKLVDDLNRRTPLEYEVLDYDYRNDKEYTWSMDASKLHFFQYDFDFDGIDEIVVGFEQKEECISVNEVLFTIFKLSGDSFKAMKFLQGGPMLDFTPAVLSPSRLSGFGISEVYVNGNVLTLDRKLRGFYFKYYVERGFIVPEYNY